MTKISDDGSIRYGGSSYSSSNTFLYCYAQVNGGDIYYTDDWTKSSYSSPITLNALERQLKAELQDQIWFPSATYCTDNIKEYTLYCNGTLASTVTWNMTRLKDSTSISPEAVSSDPYRRSMISSLAVPVQVGW